MHSNIPPSSVVSYHWMASSTSELDIVLFEFKYIKKSAVPDPNSAKAKNIIAAKRTEAIKQLEDYASADNLSGKKLLALLLYFWKVYVLSE